MTTASAKDPVCGMTVDPASPRGGSHVHGGVTYGFCSPRCRERFAAEPEKFLAGGPVGMGEPVQIRRRSLAIVSDAAAAPTAATATSATASAKDPVCGMTVDPASPRGGSHAHAGTTYHFCSPRCRERFAAEPERFLASGPVGMHEPAPPPAPAAHEHAAHAGHAHAPAPRAAAAATAWVCPMCPEVRETSPVPCPVCGMALEPEHPLPAATGAAQYTCPMHPEVVQDAPGDCPICGMALEPVLPAAAAAPPEDAELRDMRRRFRVAAALTVPTVLLAMSDLIPGQPVQRAVSPSVLAWIQLVLSAPVVLWCGRPFLERGWASLVRRRLNMFTLIALGTMAALGFSVLATIFPGLLPAHVSHGGAAPVYFEAAAVIVTLALLGQVLELRARGATADAIRALVRATPRSARRIDADGRERDVSVDHLRPGDRLRVRPGEQVPADGEVLEGESTVDESMMTGEPAPVAKAAGARALSGTLNQGGTLVMRADRIGSDTLLAQIVALVSSAQRTRAPIQRLADVVSGAFVPAVVLIAIATALVWGAWGPEPRLAFALVNAVAVLIVACPCALGLATPMSIMVGTGRGARAGVLVRSAEALEILHRVDTLVLDKTGTLTEGRPRLVAIEPVAGTSEAELLALAAALERGSEHPLASAILAGARERGLDEGAKTATGFAAITGRGVKATVDGQAVLLGNARLLSEHGVDPAPLAERAAALRAQGQTVVFLARAPVPAGSETGALLGLLGVADPIKPTARAALDALRADGLSLVMITGDEEATARAVAQQLGIDEVHAGVLPPDKAAHVTRLRAAGRTVAMAGDGTNDAPALATAHVGIAMGTGTDVAVQSAGITLVQGDLAALVRARHLSSAVMRNIRQNLAFAFLYNALGVPVAAGVLYPVFGLLLSPMLASAAMALSSVSVIGNALRLRRVRV